MATAPKPDAIPTNMLKNIMNCRLLMCRKRHFKKLRSIFSGLNLSRRLMLFLCRVVFSSGFKGLLKKSKEQNLQADPIEGVLKYSEIGTMK